MNIQKGTGDPDNIKTTGHLWPNPGVPMCLQRWLGFDSAILATCRPPALSPQGREDVKHYKLTWRSRWMERKKKLGQRTQMRQNKHQGALWTEENSKGGL